jgi:hypothetical protein
MNMHSPRKSEVDEAVTEMRKAEAGEREEGGRRGGVVIKKVQMHK